MHRIGRGEKYMGLSIGAGFPEIFISPAYTAAGNTFATVYGVCAMVDWPFTIAYEVYAMVNKASAIAYALYVMTDEAYAVVYKVSAMTYVA
uniref:Uncharacterized protein n=1 Tax=Candidatus Kentrum sp. SD TaxID=2126332 RepID=A0A451BLC9_9GAMM|nr:MAG: hypothetical protein BECKSD772D_GA0070982_103430 [Candidatus Kentron sp. SD]